MKKKYVIILGVLFAISLIFIVTGTLVVKNTFYVINNSSETLSFELQDTDGKSFDILIESGDSVLIFEKQFLSFSSKPKSIGFFINSPLFSGKFIEYEENLWKIKTNRRENVYYYIVEANNE